ncbi:MAG: polymerase subunit gamma and tau, partial [Myxococcales bacterium]|nr:polymerase subunit gamma and tau [Myxococcales bacterium]
QALAAKAPAGLFPALFDRWARAVDEAGKSQTPRLLFEMAAVDLAAAEPLVPIGDLLERLDALEVRLAGGGGGAPAGRANTPVVPGVPPASRASSVPAAPASEGARSWATPPAVARPSAPPPAESKPAPPPAPSAPSGGGAPEDAWRAVLARFESKPMLGARLAHAEVLGLVPGAITLAFPDKYTADVVEKSRKDIEEAASSVLGQPTKVNFTVGATTRGAPAVLRSEVGVETDAATADRRNREAEARQHPLIQKAQDVFNAALKEVKTP